MGQAARDVAEHRQAERGQVRGLAHDDRADDHYQRCGHARRQPAQPDPRDDGRDRRQRGAELRVRKLAERVHEPGQGAAAAGRHAKHVGELPDRDPDADPGEEADQDGPGQEVGEEAEPGQPGQQQHRPGEQGGQPGQRHVLWRPRRGQSGQPGGQDRSGGGVGADHEMAGRAEHREHGHRQQDRVEAGHHRHAGDLRVAEDLGNAQRRPGEAGHDVGADVGTADRKDTLQQRQSASRPPWAAFRSAQLPVAPLTQAPPPRGNAK